MIRRPHFRRMKALRPRLHNRLPKHQPNGSLNDRVPSSTFIYYTVQHDNVLALL